jgi:hypothetical protein
MKLPEGVRWEDLPESAQKGIVDVIVTLAGGFTGTLELDCKQGGVGYIRPRPAGWRPGALAPPEGRT